MTPKKLHSDVWGLVRRQHGTIARRQLLELGLSADAIRHRVANGRLHPVHRGVYAVGRPQLTRRGYFMAAVLACGPGAALSHASAAELWEIRPPHAGAIEVSAPRYRARPGLRVHRQRHRDVTRRTGIPVTSVTATLIDLAARHGRDPLEGAISEAVNRDLIDPERLRSALDVTPKRPGMAVLRLTLDRHTFRVTRSVLERLLIPLALRAGLPMPETGVRVNGYEVDFFWRELGLVVETDGLRFHRSAEQQRRDRLRDQAHTAAGLTVLRFTHYQVVHEPEHVLAVLTAVARRLYARVHAAA